MQSRLQPLYLLPLFVLSAACVIESPDDDDAVSSVTEGGDDAGSAGGTDAGTDTGDDSNGSAGSSGDSDPSGGSTDSGSGTSTGGGESSDGESGAEESSGESGTSGAVTNCAELCGVTGDNDQTACADGYFNDLGYSTDGPACTAYFLTEDQDFCLPCVAEMGASDGECADAHSACF